MLDKLPIEITTEALAEIKNIMINKGIPSGYGLRVGVKGGGCGASFFLGFDKKKEGDLDYLYQEVPVYIEKKHTMYLIGLEIDFEETSEGRGFTFNNPNNG